MSLDIRSAGQTSVAPLAERSTPAQTPGAQAPGVSTGPYVPEPIYHPQLQAWLQPTTQKADGPSFASQVQGKDAKSIDLDLMKLAGAAYDPSVTTVGNWSRVSDADLQKAGVDPAKLNDYWSGFKAGVYSDGKGDYVLAYAGSEPGVTPDKAGDWITDALQGTGVPTKQYDKAVELAQLVTSAYGDDVVVTGHSLGGGLASIAALASGAPAVTFNAAGVHDNTYARYGLDPAAAKSDAANGDIRRYNIEGEMLTSAQEDTFGVSAVLPDAPGHEITLEDPHPPKLDFTWNPIDMAARTAKYAAAEAYSPVRLHLQDSLIDALTAQHPWS